MGKWMENYCHPCPYFLVSLYIYLDICCMFITWRAHGRFLQTRLNGYSYLGKFTLDLSVMKEMAA